MKNKINLKDYPDREGHFKNFGGVYVSETLIHPLKELFKAYKTIATSASFRKTLKSELKDYVGRPTPIYYAESLSKKLGSSHIYLKREDLNHTGAHKINNALGQALLAKKMGKTRIIAETGAGQHGVATATACARLDLKCVVYMGEQDIQRQSVNVYRMKLLGAEVVPVNSGTKTLKDALNEALRDWVTNVDDTHYIIGSVAGPHPYPMIVRDFQSIIGHEARAQFKPLSAGAPGVLHGNRTYIMEDKNGQIKNTHSISAGLDYPGVGPEHSWLKDLNRVEYTSVTDKEALSAFFTLTQKEGIIPALETAHALAYSFKLAKKSKNKKILINLSGRGDKDIDTIARLKNIKL